MVVGYLSSVLCCRRRLMLATVPHCAFDVERGPDWLLVRVRDLDVAVDDPQFAESVWRLLKQHFTYRVVLELDGLPTLTDEIIDQLVDLHHRVATHDGVMRLCGLSPQNRRVLDVCGLGDRLHPYGNRAEAVMGELHPVRHGF